MKVNSDASTLYADMNHSLVRGRAGRDDCLLCKSAPMSRRWKNNTVRREALQVVNDPCSVYCTTYTRVNRTWITLASSHTSYFYQLLCLPLFNTFLHGPIHPHLPPLLHTDWGSGLCADWGWLEHCAVHSGSWNLSPCALNVPLQQQFLSWEMMWWASVKGSEGGWLRQGGGLVMGKLSLMKHLAIVGVK